MSASKWTVSFAQFADTTGVRQDLKGNAVRGFSHTLGLGAAEFVLRLGFTAVLARLISPEHFGLVMLVTAVTAIADQFRDLGLSTATIQRQQITHDEVSNLFWLNAAAGALIAVVVCALSPLIAGYFREPRLTAVTMAIASTFVLGGLSVQHEALLGRQMRVGLTATMRLLAFVASSMIAVVMATLEYGYWALVWREVLRSAFIAMGVWTFCPWVPGRPRRGTKVREMVKFGSSLTLTYMVSAVASSLDRFLLGPTQGAELVGLYRQSYQLVVAPAKQLTWPLQLVSLPSLSMLQDQPARYCRVFTRIVSVVALVSMPTATLVAIWAEECALVMLGPQWLGASTLIRIFAIGALWESVFSIAGFVLVSRGRSAELLRLTLVLTAWRASLMALGVPWGGMGVAIADVSSSAIAFLPYLSWALRESPVSLTTFIQALARPLAGTVFVGIALVVLKASMPVTSPAISLAAALVATVLVFPCAVFTLPGGRGDIEAFKSAAMSILKRANV